MPRFLLDDQNDGYSRGLSDLEEVLLLQNGRINPTLGQTFYGRRIPK